MEQNIIETFQSLQLTKEEEEDISISSASRLELLEECSLSLFRRLLLDRQQNLRALKSTLKSMWKMCSDLRIVEVGNNTLQFKFSSRYQMEWVEKSGPWNFDNNLLLCRWKKGPNSSQHQLHLFSFLGSDLVIAILEYDRGRWEGDWK